MAGCLQIEDEKIHSPSRATGMGSGNDGILVLPLLRPPLRIFPLIRYLPFPSSSPL